VHVNCPLNVHVTHQLHLQHTNFFTDTFITAQQVQGCQRQNLPLFRPSHEKTSLIF
jgi:hypothetical protein